MPEHLLHVAERHAARRSYIGRRWGMAALLGLSAIEINKGVQVNAILPAPGRGV